MEKAERPTEILAFVSQHTPSKSRVFAQVRNSGQLPGLIGLEAVATIAEPGRADELCAALNQYIYDREDAVGFHARLRSVLASEPESVKAAIHQLLDRIRVKEIYGKSLLKAVSPFGSFPLSACPSDGCPACGDCVNSCKDCKVCDEWDMSCDCSVQMPPRTAAMISATAELFCDMIHDLADHLPPGVPRRAHHDLWPVPRCAHRQSREFYQRFARAFEDIARDIQEGELPDPHNMAEEIALHLVLDHAAELVDDEADELELWASGIPDSRFDFDFDGLHDTLYQDKDYEYAYLHGDTVAKPGDLEEWFTDFASPASRDPNRGFRR